MAGIKLFDYKTHIQQYIESLKQISGFDFYVADRNLIRIAGTGEYRSYIGMRFPDKCATSHVTETGEPLFIYNSTSDEVCKECMMREDCYKETLMIYPIKDAEKTIGAIALSSFTAGK